MSQYPDTLPPKKVKPSESNKRSKTFSEAIFRKVLLLFRIENKHILF